MGFFMIDSSFLLPLGNVSVFSGFNMSGFGCGSSTCCKMVLMSSEIFVNIPQGPRAHNRVKSSCFIR